VKFDPRAPREGINVTATHPLKEAAILVAGLAVVIVILVAVAAWGTDIAVRFISPETETKLFDAMKFDPIFDTVGSSSDPRTESTQRLLDRMAAHWTDAPYHFKVTIIKRFEANAFALPGGHVVITTGLLDEIGSENELSFVLGHELGHFRHRDHLRRLGRVAVTRLAIAAIVGSSGALPDLAGRVGDLTSHKFDRQQERDADRFGLDLVHAEYGHVGSTWTLFDRMLHGAGPLGQFAAYLSTHPANASRVDDLKRYARGRGWTATGPTTALPRGE